MVGTSSRHILVVDDLVDNILLLQTVLEVEGYEVETADSGSLALIKIAASPPSLVLLDIMMPGVNGYEVTQWIRQNQQLPFIPILLVTAHGEINASEGLALGANDFIRKPIDLEELLAKVKVFCR